MAASAARRAKLRDERSRRNTYFLRAAERTMPATTDAELPENGGKTSPSGRADGALGRGGVDQPVMLCGATYVIGLTGIIYEKRRDGRLPAGTSVRPAGARMTGAVP